MRDGWRDGNGNRSRDGLMAKGKKTATLGGNQRETGAKGQPDTHIGRESEAHQKWMCMGVLYIDRECVGLLQ